MPAVEYRSPSGAVISNPQLKEMVNVILQPRAEYWESGSGGASATFQHDDGKMSLLLWFYNQKYGFLMEYRPDAANHNRFFAVSSDDMQTLTEVYVSGEPHRFPAGLFIEPEVASRVVDGFLKTGLAPADVKWRNRRELNWDDESE